MKKILLFTPIVIYITLIVVTTIPHGFTIMYEPSHPWYTPYTSVIFINVAMWFLPATALCSFYEIELFGLSYYIVAAVYTLFLTALLCVIYNHLKKNIQQV